MTCKLQPKIIPYRIILEGSFSATTSLAPIITIEADINNLTTLLGDEELSKYIRAICDIRIDDTTNTTKATQLKNADISSNIISFDANLLETMYFDWRVPHTDILCETYIMVDTVQMSEDYNIEISDDYKNMKGEVERTYIIQGGEINSDLTIMDSREVAEADTGGGGGGSPSGEESDSGGGGEASPSSEESDSGGGGGGSPS